MAHEHHVEVVIYGRTYQLAGADPDYTRKLARKVDQAMTRFAAAGSGSTDSYKLAMLAALHIADELASVREEYESYRSEVGTSAARVLELVEASLAQLEAEAADSALAQDPAESE